MRASLDAVKDREVLFAECFYRRLFERTPRLRPLFPDDLSVQRERLTGALMTAMGTATSADPQALAGFEDTLARMGARHATRYGVRAEYYPLVGDALVQAARDVAGPVWSTRTSSAWVAVYEWLAGHMIRGAAEAGDTRPIPPSLHRAVAAATTTRPPRPLYGAAPHGGAGLHDVTRPLPPLPLPPDDPGAALPRDRVRHGGFPPPDHAPVAPWTDSQLPLAPLTLLVSVGGRR
ncbi:globin domain-containing protein [Cryptosporangium sp. NPDC048952]|uniref:globin domain-containing protein n=1 Tax=Cryptosporangium sp. NPDC048952 TaxID=3363961 RepID=UPI00371DC980